MCNCKKRHHALLHPVKKGIPNNSSNYATQNYQTNQHTAIGLNDETPELPQQGETTINTQLGVKFTFLDIIPVKLSNGHTFIETNALLDCASDIPCWGKTLHKY